MIGLSAGNLITHLRKLEDANYIQTIKSGNGPSSRTQVVLTPRGRQALGNYTATLRDLINGL
jgi:DNA-binding MarR family transcriptional regulator